MKSKTKKSAETKKWRLPRGLLYLHPGWALHCGALQRNGMVTYALIARHVKSGATETLAMGENLSSFLSFLKPWPIHAEIGAGPLHFVSTALDGIDPEVWIDRNELKIIPRGLTADQTITEWAAEGDDRICAATIKKDLHQNIVDHLKAGHCLLSSLSVPLWDLARLYAAHIDTPFVLWRITDEGSTLGFCKNGTLTRLCAFWADSDDIRKDASGVAQEIALLLPSLTLHEKAPIILAPSSENSFSALAVAGYEIAPPPDCGIPLKFHEPYALALHSDTHLDFAPFSDVQNAREMARRRSRGLRISLAAANALLLCALIMGLMAGGLALGRRIAGSKIKPAREQIAALDSAMAHRDTLSARLWASARYAQRESMTTFALSALQDAFPEGVWAEQIAVTERDTTHWGIDILALSYSTGLIPDFLRLIGDIPGVSDARMLYSEQIALGNGRNAKKAIRLKVSCLWNQHAGLETSFNAVDKDDRSREEGKNGKEKKHES
jgi:Tfp pilus assembly protein PilN